MHKFHLFLILKGLVINLFLLKTFNIQNIIIKSLYTIVKLKLLTIIKYNKTHLVTVKIHTLFNFIFTFFRPIPCPIT